jgi:uncharacterized protein YbjT (DUF2867 family)
MRSFVTGASGWIGSGVVAELIGSGHQVVGLARSDASAETVAAAGAEVRRGDIGDLDLLRSAAAEATGSCISRFVTIVRSPATWRPPSTQTSPRSRRSATPWPGPIGR